MYLKSIEVHGFKSFANKIDFQFHNGITGIVGPNGSGKSNVADAVRWVLGEQSAKQLRGSSMQDVIFSGTENRKPQGYAYVAITLDNADHQLAIDYEEVTVARRVYRSGESEYLINGTACRLRDVNELFYDTGIGKEGYSIIGQGQIDRILSGKPEDRRELFDEAAGIVKFKRRKATAVKKLEDEESNLVRVNDILGELEKQVGPLERQSEKARIYLKKKEELKTLEVNAFLLEVERLQTQVEETEKKFKIASDDLEGTSTTYEETKDEYEKMQAQIEELDHSIEEKRTEIGEADLTRQKLVSQIELMREQIHSAQQSDEHHKNRQEIIAKDLAAKEEELQQLLTRKAEIDLGVQEATEQREDAKESLQALQSTIQHLSSTIEKCQQGIMNALNDRTAINTELGKCDSMMEQIEIRRAQLNSRLLRAKTDEAEIDKEYQTCMDKLKEVAEIVRGLDEKIAATEQKIGEISDSIRKKEQEQTDAQAIFHELKSKLESLRNLTERYEGYGNSIRKVMEKKDKRVCGVVADLFQVEKKYETAIETALGGNIQNIVTEDEATAKDMIRFLKENRLGRATFLPLTSVREREFNAPDALDETGVIGLADTLIKTDSKYAGIASHLLHNYIVVDTVDHALAIAKKFKYTLRIVTVGGEALNPGGSISGGAFKNSSNLLGRNREMEELAKKVENAKKKVDDLLDEIETLRDERKKLRSEADSLRDDQQEKLLDQNTAKMNVNRAKERQEEAKKGFASIHSEEGEIVRQVAQIESRKKEIADNMESSQRFETESRKKIEEQTKLLEQRREREGQVLANLSELEISVAQLLQKQAFEQSNLDRILAEKKRLTEEDDFINASLSQTATEIEQKNQDILAIEETIEASKLAGEEGRKWLEEHLAKKDAIAKAQKDYLDQREELNKRISSLDKETYRLNAQLEKLQEARDGQINYMWNEYEVTVAQAKDIRDPEKTDLPAMKRDILAVKSAIRELGDVNVNAIEDYRNLMERYEFMRGQRDDLVAAKESLQQVIADLDEGMRKQFTEKFSQIATQFDKVFKELFGGGKGTLELLEDADILEAGIRIIAQPPGKKLQNMMQLSGGEKALTAIALLFAIQNLKPSPFCLLDEIEAALDESNVGRFAGYLQKLTKNTQFIVITHRRGTMEKADRLYGITMQEKGVSALVSVNMIDDKQLTN